MPVKSDPTTGWRNRDIAGIMRPVTIRQKREMAQRVAKARDAKGMTNESLARASGLSVKTISAIVNAKREPREHSLKSVAKALGTTPAEIRGFSPIPVGLGAREDQVDAGFVEFRKHVFELDAKLDRIIGLLGERAVEEGARELAASGRAGSRAPAAPAKARAGKDRERRDG